MLTPCADAEVGVIYIATPQSHHFQNTMLCLKFGKNVLCEKAFTVNARQARILVETAKSKNLFLMEGMWVRWFPLSIKIRKLVKEGKIGEVQRVIADLSIGYDVMKVWGPNHRTLRKELAGGSLLECKYRLCSTYCPGTG